MIVFSTFLTYKGKFSTSGLGRKSPSRVQPGNGNFQYLPELHA